MDKTTKLVLGGLGLGGLLWWLSRRQAAGASGGEYYPAPDGGGFVPQGGLMMIRQPAQDPAPSTPISAPETASNAPISARTPAILSGGLDVAGAAAAGAPVLMAPPLFRVAFEKWISNRAPIPTQTNPEALTTTQAALDAFTAARGRIEALARGAKASIVANQTAGVTAWWKALDPDGAAAWDRAVCPSVPVARARSAPLSTVCGIVPKDFGAFAKAMIARGASPVSASQLDPVTRTTVEKALGYKLVPYDFGSGQPATIAPLPSLSKSTPASTSQTVSLPARLNLGAWRRR